MQDIFFRKYWTRPIRDGLLCFLNTSNHTGASLWLKLLLHLSRYRNETRHLWPQSISRVLQHILQKYQTGKTELWGFELSVFQRYNNTYSGLLCSFQDNTIKLDSCGHIDWSFSRDIFRKYRTRQNWLMAFERFFSSKIHLYSVI